MDKELGKAMAKVVIAKGLASKYININRILRDVSNIEDAYAEHNNNDAVASLLSKATDNNNSKLSTKVDTLELQMGRLIKAVNTLANP